MGGGSCLFAWLQIVRVCGGCAHDFAQTVACEPEESARSLYGHELMIIARRAPLCAGHVDAEAAGSVPRHGLLTRVP